VRAPNLTVPAIASQERLPIGYLSRLLRIPSLAPNQHSSLGSCAKALGSNNRGRRPKPTPLYQLKTAGLLLALASLTAAFFVSTLVRFTAKLVAGHLDQTSCILGLRSFFVTSVSYG
jgi:hypothetical protein